MFPFIENRSKDWNQHMYVGNETQPVAQEILPPNPVVSLNPVTLDMSKTTYPQGGLFAVGALNQAGLGQFNLPFLSMSGAGVGTDSNEDLGISTKSRNAIDDHFRLAQIVHASQLVGNLLQPQPQKMIFKRPAPKLLDYDGRPINAMVERGVEAVSGAQGASRALTAGVGEQLVTGQLAGSQIQKIIEQGATQNMQAKTQVDQANAQILNTNEAQVAEISAQEQLANRQQEAAFNAMKQEAVSSNIDAILKDEHSRLQTKELLDQQAINNALGVATLQYAVEKAAFEGDEWATFKAGKQAEDLKMFNEKLGPADETNPAYADLVKEVDEMATNSWKLKETALDMELKKANDLLKEIQDPNSKFVGDRVAAEAAVKAEIEKANLLKQTGLQDEIAAFKTTTLKPKIQAARDKQIAEYTAASAANKKGWMDEFRKLKGITSPNFAAILKLIKNN